MKLNTKKIHEFVDKYQKELVSMKQYFSKCEQNSSNSGKTIIEINKEIKDNIKAISGDKQTVKIIKQYAENNQQRESCDKNVQILRYFKTQYIKSKVNNWMTICEQILDKIKENMRKIDAKNQKKQLGDQEILEFKKFLTDSILNFEENKEAIVEHFATQQINSNCILLQGLTNRMQRMGNK